MIVNTRKHYLDMSAKIADTKKTGGKRIDSNVYI